MTILPAAELGQTVARLFDAVSLDLLNPLVHANFSAQCDAAARRSLLSRNLPHHVEMPAMKLIRYPPGTLVYGDRSYLTVAGDGIVAEQVAPWCVDPIDEARRMRAQPDRAIDVGQETLLLARFGENTWGHWVAEMLAKAAIAERFFPGRFDYAVPWWTTEPHAAHNHGERGFADAVLESLAAYGIPPSRLVRMSGFQFYRFGALHDVTGFWQDGPHPGALACLRALDLPKTSRRKRRKIAVLRRPPEARALHNADEVQNHLNALGFSVVDLGAQNFTAQIGLFREADVLVGCLGSAFTAALYAEPGKKIISLAPAHWADGYFIRMFQHIEARHADLRGPCLVEDTPQTDRSPHLIDAGDLDSAMTALKTRSASADFAMVDGEAMPRSYGERLLSISFTTDENAVFTGAWSAPESAHRWSLGESSGLRIARGRLPRNAAIWLEIEGQGHVYPPHLPTRPLRIMVNGVRAGDFDVIGRARYACRLSPDMLGGGSEITLDFLHPVCPSPRMMGAGDDDRRLGFGFEKLTFYGLALKN
jgi:hypothetical protein